MVRQSEPQSDAHDIFTEMLRAQGEAARQMMATVLPQGAEAVPSDAQLTEWGESALKLQQMWFDFHKQQAIPEMPVCVSVRLAMSKTASSSSSAVSSRSVGPSSGVRSTSMSQHRRNARLRQTGSAPRFTTVLIATLDDTRVTPGIRVSSREWTRSRSSTSRTTRRSR